MRPALLALAIAFLAPGNGWSHGIGVEAKIVGPTVFVTGFHDDDSPAAGAKAAVFSTGGPQVAQGELDSTGKWSFPMPKGGDYRIEISGDDEHRAMVRLSVPEGSPAVGPTPQQSGQASQAAPRHVLSMWIMVALAAGTAVAALAVWRPWMARPTSTS
ncbi:MAG: hypothetical protein ACKO9Z_11380 [Planctomycetota bacterium]|nr:hypothetical protein [Planctomycetota bacterium]